MSNFSPLKSHLIPITILISVIFILPLDSFVFAQEQSDLEKLIYYGETDGKNISIVVTPITPLVGTIFFSIDLQDTINGLPISDASVKFILGINDEYIFESIALANPETQGNYIAKLTVDHAGEWTTYVKIEETNGNKTQLAIPLTVQGSPLTAGLTGTILWGIVFCVIVSIGFYIWKNSKSNTDI